MANKLKKEITKMMEITNSPPSPQAAFPLSFENRGESQRTDDGVSLVMKKIK